MGGKRSVSCPGGFIWEQHKQTGTALMQRVPFNLYTSIAFNLQMHKLYANILIMKANEMHYISYLFHNVLYMFRTCPLSIIRSISTLFTHNRYLSCYFCWLSANANRTSM